IYHAANHPDPQIREQQLKNYPYYSLLLPFLNGMLEAAKNNVQLIDGNEPAYYYKKSEDFYQAYWKTRQASLLNVPPSLHQKYQRHVRAGQALYMDYVFDRQGQGLSYTTASGMT